MILVAPDPDIIDFEAGCSTGWSFCEECSHSSPSTHASPISGQAVSAGVEVEEDCSNSSQSLTRSSSLSSAVVITDRTIARGGQ